MWLLRLRFSLGIPHRNQVHVTNGTTAGFPLNHLGMHSAGPELELPQLLPEIGCRAGRLYPVQPSGQALPIRQVHIDRQRQRQTQQKGQQEAEDPTAVGFHGFTSRYGTPTARSNSAKDFM